ncbi:MULTISPECIES: hypothetical protein [Geobacillus]|uniref:hypothetical protein n=1 Tax=Geobacillus TaxID=129337 RepID=UPI00067BBB8F|nr:MULTISPECIES: hypothetical protein [Geobacillus]ASS87989.1 hypothetical protein GLN3_13780 [Geobacillus lituanicus]
MIINKRRERDDVCSNTQITAAKGYADQVVERFKRPGIIEQQDGFEHFKSKKRVMAIMKLSF